ncbi:MAG: hypothetical protein J6K04_11015 [Lachnospiraceae bacterium]|nr:hypothetical protein [Lachnospiraceae bacterium]
MDENKKTAEYIVGFVDVLGSKEEIKKDAEKSFKMMNDTYMDAIMLFKKLFKNGEVTPVVKIFSDNIVVAVSREKESGHGAFLAVAMLCAIIQVQFLKHGMLVRGGVSSGSFFASDLMVWGEGLIESYKLENSIAVYPRIIISPNLIGELGLASENIKSKLLINCREWITQDRDGLFMVDYVNNYLVDRDSFIFIMLELIEQKLITYNDNIKVCQKWLWFNSYMKDKIILKEKFAEETILRT